VFYDVKTGEETLQWGKKLRGRGVRKLFSRDGKTLYFLNSKRVEGHEVATGKLLRTLELDKAFAEEWIDFESFAVSPLRQTGRRRTL
jgi:hypothetical protein